MFNKCCNDSLKKKSCNDYYVIKNSIIHFFPNHLNTQKPNYM